MATRTLELEFFGSVKSSSRWGGRRSFATFNRVRATTASSFPQKPAIGFFGITPNEGRWTIRSTFCLQSRLRCRGGKFYATVT